MCVGEVLLKQWKQGNTSFSKTRKRSLEIEVFFLCLISDKNMDEYFHLKTNKKTNTGPIELHKNVTIRLDIFLSKLCHRHKKSHLRVT